MKLAQALKEKLMDVRLRDKLLENGSVSKDQVEAYKKSLNDDQKNAEFIKSSDQPNKIRFTEQQN